MTLCLLVRPPDWGLDRGELILVSMGFGVAAWAILALFVAARATVRTANSRAYHGLVNLVSWLDSTLDRLDDPDPRTNACATEIDRLRTEVYEVRAILEVYPVFRLTCQRVPEPRSVVVEASAFRGEVHWLLGTAYNELYRRIHLIEADLLLLCSEEELRAFAIADYFRLADSQVNRHELWQYQIERAIVRLGDDPYDYFQRPGPRASNGPVVPDGPKVKTPPTDDDVSMARFLLRKVRIAVDEFRDSSFEGLVRLRGRTMWTLFAASLTVYVSLIVAALCEADPKVLVGAGAFFLTGVLVGLLSRMLSEQQLASDIEDYGLSTVRLFQTIVISGIAAVLGVVVATYSIYAFEQSNVVPTTAASTPSAPSPQAAAASTQSAAPPLRDIFDLRQSPVLLLVAAAFALTPGLVLKNLEKSAASLKQEIKSIEPGSKATV